MGRQATATSLVWKFGEAGRPPSTTSRQISSLLPFCPISNFLLHILPNKCIRNQTYLHKQHDERFPPRCWRQLRSVISASFTRLPCTTRSSCSPSTRQPPLACPIYDVAFTFLVGKRISSLVLYWLLGICPCVTTGDTCARISHCLLML
jgi:hypothetical protein